MSHITDLDEYKQEYESIERQIEVLEKELLSDYFNNASNLLKIEALRNRQHEMHVEVFGELQVKPVGEELDLHEVNLKKEKEEIEKL